MEEPRHMGKCALCGEHTVLKDSHLIPKWAYRRLQKTDEGRTDPIRIEGGSAVQTSDQVTMYLLCAACEHRFSTREDYVSRLTQTDPEGTLKILGSVTRQAPPLAEVVQLDSELDIDAIVYFAASVIWRSCVMKHGCTLGERYELAFRRYLLGETDFPSNVASMNLVILEPSGLVRHPERYVSFPSSSKVPNAWLHGFTVCGLTFRCFVGGSLDAGMKMVNLAGGSSPKYALLRNPEGLNDFVEVHRTTAAATPRGKLALLNVWR